MNDRYRHKAADLKKASALTRYRDIVADAARNYRRNLAKLLLACDEKNIFGTRIMPEALSRNLIFDFKVGADLTPQCEEWYGACARQVNSRCTRSAVIQCLKASISEAQRLEF